jgi:formylglycine-generating enzyme required for sulfatase activity
MILVKGDAFRMGSNENDEITVHEIELDSFSIGRFPLVQDFWESI